MKKQSITARRFCGIALLAVPGLILAAVLGGSLYLRSLLKDIHYIQPASSPTLSLQEQPGQPEQPPFLSESSAEPVPMEDSGILNILLIGRDARAEDTHSRSDTMILCTFHLRDKHLTLTSFLRDLYVEIPGYQDNRLNAAYAFGGVKLLRQTLEENFGISIDGAVEVDFSCFPDIIDLLGGVRMELRQDEAETINASVPNSALTEGTHLLTGQQALAYSRIRSLDSDGDFSRTRRQRKVLLALMDAYRDAGLFRGLALAKKLLPFVSTDMTRDTILSHAARLAPILSDMNASSQTIPAEDTYTYQTIRGMSVLVADMDAARRQLEETLQEPAQ